MLIEDVRSHPIIYNISHPGYKNIREKTKVWAEIAAAHKMSVKDTKKCWKQLKDCYSRHLKRRSDEWIYRSQMAFLRDPLQPRKTVGNYSRVSDEKRNVSAAMELVESRPSSPVLSDFILSSTSTSADDYSSSSTPQTSCGKRRRKQLRKISTDVEDTFLKTMEAAQEFIKEKAQREDPPSDDEDVLFCRFITAKLKKFPLKQKNETKVGILKYFRDMENQQE